MAQPSAVLKFFLFTFLALAYLGGSECHLLKGSVSCLDCRSQDLSGITVAVECRQDKKQATTLTDDKGYFEAPIPSGSPNCFARILGGPKQLCSYKKSMMNIATKVQGSNSDYTLSAPLTFLISSCPLKTEKPKNEIGSSKTIDLPLPREWGLAPSSYYLPFFPIIGIP